MHRMKIPKNSKTNLLPVEHNTTYKTLLPWIRACDGGIKYPSYELINRPLSLCLKDVIESIDGYKYLPSLGDQFISFCRPEFYNELSLNAKSSPINTGWKAHLSCHPQDVGKLWDIAVPILLKYKCSAFKCIKLSSNPVEEGRAIENVQFTMYMQAGEEQRYNAILAEIEEKLQKENVKPAATIPLSDRRLGLFTSVRFSGYGEPLHYINEQEAKFILESKRAKNMIRDISWYNVAGHYDPFETITEISPANEAQMTKRRRLYSTSGLFDPEFDGAKAHKGKSNVVQLPSGPLKSI